MKQSHYMNRNSHAIRKIFAFHYNTQDLLPWSHKPATSPYPQIHYFNPKAQNCFFTTHVSIILSAMPTSPSSTFCTRLTNTLSFTYFL